MSEREREYDQFYIEEYKTLKAEIAANGANTIAILQYVVLSSAIVYAFLLGYTPEKLPTPSGGVSVQIPLTIKTIVWCIPTAASVIGAIVSLIIGYHSARIGRYIKCYLEPTHPILGTKYGWEHHISRGPGHLLLALSVVFPWLVVIVLNAVALSFGLGAL